MRSHAHTHAHAHAHMLTLEDAVNSVHLSLQADGKVASEDIPVFGVYRPACHDSSLYLFVLDIFLEAVVLPQEYYQFVNGISI